MAFCLSAGVMVQEVPADAHHCLSHRFEQCCCLSKQPGAGVRDAVWRFKVKGILLLSVQRYSLSACPAEVQDKTHGALHEYQLSCQLSLGQ